MISKNIPQLIRRKAIRSAARERMQESPEMYRLYTWAKYKIKRYYDHIPSYLWHGSKDQTKKNYAILNK